MESVHHNPILVATSPSLSFVLCLNSRLSLEEGLRIAISSAASAGSDESDSSEGLGLCLGETPRPSMGGLCLSSGLAVSARLSSDVAHATTTGSGAGVGSGGSGSGAGHGLSGKTWEMSPPLRRPLGIHAPNITHSIREDSPIGSPTTSLSE